MQRQIHKWTDEEKAYLKSITPGHHHKEILELMNDKFEYNFSLRQISAAIKRYNLTTGFTGRFNKGCKTWNKGVKGYMGANKTSFKKGNIPANLRDVGNERITKDGYIEIKVSSHPPKWELKHRVVYEQHYGPIKKDHAIIFLDGDKLNTDITNLKMVTRNQLLMLNRNKLIKNNAELTNAGINVANVLIKINEVKKEGKK